MATKVSRRKLIVGASAGAVTLGALAAVPVYEIVKNTSKALPASAATSGPLMVYVTDPTSAQVTLLVGSQEIHFTDSTLVARLLQAAQ
jgi:hypothetical protein